MNNEKRAYFRFDVSISVYLEPSLTQQKCFHVSKEQLIKSHEYHEIADDNALLKALFKDEVHIENGAVALFDGINQKLEFVVWLLDSIVQGEDISLTDEYRQKLLVNQILIMPSSDSNSKIMALLQGLYRRIDEILLELLPVVEGKLHGKVFMYHQASPPVFKLSNYVGNLPTLAEQGNWLAKVIVCLTDKLNHYERMFSKLKDAYQSLSDTQHWPIYSVNLAEAGFALFLKDKLAVGDEFCVMFLLEEDFIFAQAECVSVGAQPTAQGKHRTAFKFNKISPEDAAHIVRYLTRKSLEQRELGR
ncbi:MAG: PilZ domain-containing protein [Gammaproteobacteria bacterium]|nr:PilZ domain-containing protein [Gammaproteobacteria bacterium]